MPIPEEQINELKLDVQSIFKIEHEDAISSAVYKITLKNTTILILKIYYDAKRYKRELYFLKRMHELIPVPKVIASTEPSKHKQGSILMEYFDGDIAQTHKLTPEIAFQMGKLLAGLHEIRTKHYGDIAISNEPSSAKEELQKYFDESAGECKNVLPKKLLNNARKYFEQSLDKVNNFDGPCIVHRDFKPGNIIIFNEKINGLIDWENARAGFAEEDFLRMDQLVWLGDNSSKQSFLTGYEGIRKLPDIEAMLPILRVSKQLGTMGFTIVRNTWQNRDKKIFERNLELLKSFLS